MKEKLKVAVVGVGHLGKHHARILSQLDCADLVGVYDINRANAVEVAERYGTEPLKGLVEVAAKAEAAVVATPTTTHCEVACYLAEEGLHLLVEKPIASSVQDAKRMAEVARANGVLLAVGHVEFHNPAVQAVLSLSESARYLEAQRLSPFTARSQDVDVVLDLMIHDIQIALALLKERPSELKAIGVEVLTDKVDICHAWVEFPSGAVANLTASRVSAEKVRKLRLFSRSSYFSVDYSRQEVSAAKLEGKRIIPVKVSFNKAEPLRAELEAFLEACIKRDTSGVVSAEQAVEAVEVALAIREAVAKRSRQVTA